MPAGKAFDGVSSKGESKLSQNIYQTKCKYCADTPARRATVISHPLDSHKVVNIHSSITGVVHHCAHRSRHRRQVVFHPTISEAG